MSENPGDILMWWEKSANPVEIHTYLVGLTDLTNSGTPGSNSYDFTLLSKY